MVRRDKIFKNRFFFPGVLFAGVLFVCMVLVFRMVFSRPRYVYVRARISQGLWWAQTGKPSHYFVNAVRKGMIERSLSGSPVAEVLEARSYPWWITGEYNIYVVMKLKASKNANTGVYSYKRSPLAVGSPIDIELPDIQVSATVLEISNKPFNDKYVEKEVTLVKKYAQPWEFDAVEVGDSYNDGESTVLQITGKELGDSQQIYTVEDIENKTIINPVTQERSYLVLKTKLMLLNRGGALFYAGDQEVRIGAGIPLVTKKMGYYDYTVVSVSDK